MEKPSKPRYGEALRPQDSSSSREDSDENRARRYPSPRKDRKATTETGRWGASSRLDGDGDTRSRDARDRRGDDTERKRRRSGSPAHESTRRRRDERDSKYRSRGDGFADLRGTKAKRGSTRDCSPRREDDGRFSREDSAAQVTRRKKGPLPSQAAAFQGETGELVEAGADDKDEIEKQKPNFGATGLLAAASNSISQADGTQIVLKYHEPPEARKPSSKDTWKLFVFKGADLVETIELSMRSCWLVGRDLAVVDMPAEHPSISKQHAVIQFRYIERTNEYGDKLGKVQPYLIDLESANKTSLNKEEIPPSRYLELRDKDMIQFGHSTREYVLMLSPRD